MTDLGDATHTVLSEELLHEGNASVVDQDVEGGILLVKLRGRVAG